MHKGVILEIRGDRATVLVEGGEFRDISVRGMAPVQLGQEIRLPDVAPAFAWWTALSRVRTATVVAMVLIAVLMPIGYFQFIAPGPVMAYVSLDINPSVEFGIDRNSRVIEAQGVGKDGQAMLDMVEWKHRQLEQVVTDLVKAGETRGYVEKEAENSLIITVVPKADEIPKGLEKKIEQIPQVVTGQISTAQAPAVVKVIHGNKELVEKAKELGITPGKAAVLLEAVDQGLNITANDLKTQKITDALPRAGGKTEEVLKKASSRDSQDWAQLYQKYQEEIKKRATRQDSERKSGDDDKNVNRGNGDDTTNGNSRDSQGNKGGSRDDPGKSTGNSTGRGGQNNRDNDRGDQDTRGNQDSRGNNDNDHGNRGGSGDGDNSGAKTPAKPGDKSSKDDESDDDKSRGNKQTTLPTTWPGTGWMRGTATALGRTTSSQPGS